MSESRYIKNIIQSYRYKVMTDILEVGIEYNNGISTYELHIEDLEYSGSNKIKFDLGYSLHSFAPRWFHEVFIEFVAIATDDDIQIYADFVSPRLTYNSNETKVKLSKKYYRYRLPIKYIAHHLGNIIGWVSQGRITNISPDAYDSAPVEYIKEARPN